MPLQIGSDLCCNPVPATLRCRLCRSVVFDDIRQLASAALSAADVVRRITLRRLRETFGHTKLQVTVWNAQWYIVCTSMTVHGVAGMNCTWLRQCITWSALCSAACLPAQELDFSTVVAPKAEAIFDELSDILAPYYMGANSPLAAEDSEQDESADPEGDGSSSSSMAAAARAGGVFARLGPALEQMQKFVAKAALLLWLWFDQQCEVMAEEVRHQACGKLIRTPSCLWIAFVLVGHAQFGRKLAPATVLQPNQQASLKHNGFNAKSMSMV